MSERPDAIDPLEDDESVPQTPDDSIDDDDIADDDDMAYDDDEDVVDDDDIADDEDIADEDGVDLDEDDEDAGTVI
ncbi:hypothetical protein [Mixta intestinalis]|jgi:hypothetical protein|uniref:Uncharacterized protein n=1 Tax=Mixta intestinalis TaxID=1615494 RepID=A0A6P1Q0U9_9GAMM|nr:hypothetical protein [Mixta intestinalis]QHM71465.1 hypothetical protein C7M51_01752 [Mixta intestinalis]